MCGVVWCLLQGPAVDVEMLVRRHREYFPRLRHLPHGRHLAPFMSRRGRHHTLPDKWKRHMHQNKGFPAVKRACQDSKLHLSRNVSLLANYFPQICKSSTIELTLGFVSILQLFHCCSNAFGAEKQKKQRRAVRPL